MARPEFLQPPEHAELTGVQRRVVDDVADLIDRVEPTKLDLDESSAHSHGDDVHIELAHLDPTQSIGVYVSADDQIVVDYGPEHQGFHPSDPWELWPTEGRDHVAAMLALVDALLTGRLDLQVWSRPWMSRIHTVLRDGDGSEALVGRSGTIRPSLRWSRQPTVHHFDFR